MDIKKSFNEMSVLFPILTLYTLAYLGLMIYAFVEKGAFVMPSGMMAVYIALVGAYAADKEIRRWMGKAQESKMGSVFVYAWLVFFLVAFTESRRINGCEGVSLRRLASCAGEPPALLRRVLDGY